MRIDKIEMTAFRNHDQTILELDRVNVICGLNNSGKTSILYAIEAALTGRCGATDAGGRGLDDLISVGRTASFVVLETDLGRITRTIKPSGSGLQSGLQVGSWTGSVKVQQELLYQSLGADADVIRALVNVSSFINLSAQDQKGILYDLARAEATPEEISEMIGRELLQVLREVAPAPQEALRPANFETLWQSLYKARTVAKKDLAKAQGKRELLEKEGEEKVDEADLTPAGLDKIRGDLAELERRRLLMARLSRSASEIEGRRKSLEAQIAQEAEVPAPAGGEADALADLDKAQEGLAKVRKKMNEISGKFPGMDKALEALRRATGRCPLSDTITCPITADERKAMIKDLEAERAALVKKHEKAIKDETKAARVHAEAQECYGAYAEYNAAQERLRAAQEELASLGEVEAPDPAELEHLDREIIDAQARLALAEVAAGRRGDLEGAREEELRLAGRLEDLERLLVLFGTVPESIRSRLLGDKISRISSDVSAVLQELTGGAYKVEIKIDPDFQILIDNGRGLDQVAPRHLSTSERFRVGIAFAWVLARLSRLRLLIIDDAEILDSDNRTLLSAFLVNHMSDFETVLLISTREGVASPGIPGVVTYWIEDGQATRIG